MPTCCTEIRFRLAVVSAMLIAAPSFAQVDNEACERRGGRPVLVNAGFDGSYSNVVLDDRTGKNHRVTLEYPITEYEEKVHLVRRIDIDQYVSKAQRKTAKQRKLEYWRVSHYSPYLRKGSTVTYSTNYLEIRVNESESEGHYLTLCTFIDVY